MSRAARRPVCVLAVLFLCVVAIYVAWDRSDQRRDSARAASRATEEPSPADESAIGQVSPDANGHAGAPIAAAPETGAGLCVVVVDERGHAQVGADVRVLLSAYPALVWTTPATTDETGAATFPVPAPGRVVVYARVGSVTRSRAADVDKVAATEVRIPIPRGVAVEGHVRHVDSGPLPGLVLRFQRSDGPYVDELEASTDTAGHYRLSNVAAGRYLLRAQDVSGMHFGYLDVSDVDAAERDFVFGVASLSGKVRDAVTQRPLAGVSLQIMNPFYVAAFTDAEGTYQLFDLPPGSYRITLKKDGYAVGFVDSRVDDILPRTRDLPLQPAAELRIRVTDRSGRSVTGQHLYHAQPQGSGAEAGGYVVTDGSGWIVTAVAPGVYDLSILADSFEPACQRVAVAPGENTVHFNLDPKSDVPDTCVLRGVVRDRTTGLPVAGVTLLVDGVAPVSVSDEQGEYGFRHYWPGKVSLFVLREGYGATILRDVTTEKGACRTLDIALEPAAKLKLYITDPSGDPVDGHVSMRVTSLDPERPFSLGTKIGPAKEGRMTYDQLVPGIYRLQFVGDGGRATIETDIPREGRQLDIRLQQR